MKPLTLSMLALVALLFAGCDKKAESPAADADAKTQTNGETVPEAKALTVYCGRNEEMIKPLITKFGEDSGIEVKVQYAKSAQLAATLMEEGAKTPADVFFAQDASTLGFLEKEGKLASLPDEIVSKVPENFRSNSEAWIGTSGRARVLSYNTANVKPEDLPADVDALVANEAWKGKVGWAPENASFQSFVAAMVAQRGKKATKEWLDAMMKLEPKAYPSNTPMVTAIGRGEIAIGLTNHYYLFRLKAEHGDDFAAENHYFQSGKSGAIVNAAGVGILKTSANKPAAKQFVAFLLSDESQQYFADKTHEFPLVSTVKTEKLPMIGELKVPPTDLGELGNIEPAVKLLREVGALK